MAIDRASRVYKISGNCETTVTGDLNLHMNMRGQAVN
jgi:hypothetical protein